MNDQELKKHIEQITQEWNPNAFLVEVNMHKGSKSVLRIKVDTDQGISLAECSQLSRKIGHWLEEEDVFDFRYNLELTSPGVGTPLTLHRQYVNNIGRRLSVIREDHSRVEGKLITVEESFFILKNEPSRKQKKKNSKRKKDQPKEWVISFEQVRESKVVPSLG